MRSEVRENWEREKGKEKEILDCDVPSLFKTSVCFVEVF